MSKWVRLRVPELVSVTPRKREVVTMGVTQSLAPERTSGSAQGETETGGPRLFFRVENR